MSDRAVVLRSNSDLVYLPDHGFVGEEGALRILNHLQVNTARLDISQNLLGTGGVMTLVKGLAHVRQRYSSDTSRIWTLREINIASNSLGDEALESVLGWAKKDLGCRKLLLQGNDIKLETLPHLDGILNNLSSSRLATLSLTNNPIDPDGLASFLSRLESNALTELHLSTCKLPVKAAECIASFVGKPSCRNLEYLELNGNHLGVEGVREIVDAIEQYNYGLVQVGLLANEEYPRMTGEDEDTRVTPREGYDSVQEAKQLHHLIHERLPELMFRNRFSTRRVKRAALRTLAPARILLNAQRITESDEDTAKHVMAEIAAISLDSSSTPPMSRPFRIMDLPTEILHLVIRHCSRDPSALSERQFVQLRTHAESRESLSRLVKRRKETMAGLYFREDEDVKEREMKEDWLRSGRWDKWELNARPVK